MKKSDLVSGKHIVELEDGSRYLYLEGWFANSRTWYGIDAKIYKIFGIQEVFSLSDMLVFGKGLVLIWERKPELSEAERVILENVDKKYKWIARDGYIEEEGMRAELGLFEDRPIRMNNYWSGTNCASFAFFNNLFKMVKWEDEKPTLIADLLGE